MTASNWLPFCSNCTRRAIGVLAEKKAAQLASIWACALEAGAVDELADTVGDALAEEDDELGCEDELPLLPQAAIARPAAAPSAGISRI